MSTSCAACGAGPLVPHLKVAGKPGAEGLIPTTDRFGTALGDIVRCTVCGHMQLDRFPAAADLSDAYETAESGDYVAEEAGQRTTARDVLERIETRVQRGALLDVGCWLGFLLAEARRRGWDPVVGIEPSAFASRYAREELGLDVRRGGLLDADLEGSSFEAVFMGDVIEHLPDPGEALERLRPLLAPGGVLALALPDAGSRVARLMRAHWWSVIPTHVQYFTRRSVGVLLERHGFAPVDVRSAPKAFSVRYYLERIGGYSRPLARALVGGAEAIGVADRMWAPDFRDRMLVIAAVRDRP